MPKLYAISGPTGIGKTAYAIQLAKQQDAEIISFDSRQVYKELNIGVARPSKEDLSAVKHHLIAHKSIQDKYSAQMFVEDVKAIINSNESKQTYILVGGTGFYLRALEYGLDELPSISDQTRTDIQREFNEFGLEPLQNEVKKIDPISYAQMEIDNPRRLQRIIEIWREHKLVYSDIITKNPRKELEIEHTVLDMPREDLYRRINQRVDLMMEMGLEEEVRNLIPFMHLPSLNAVGYSELFEYFMDKVNLDHALDKIKQHSRNYAKRQVTWNKKYLKDAPRIHPNTIIENI